MEEEVKPPCAGKTVLMFPPVNDRPEGMNGALADRATLPARTLCAQCFRNEECLQEAYDNKERFGIWGGINFGHRRERKEFFDAVNKHGRSIESIAHRTKKTIESKVLVSA